MSNIIKIDNGFNDLDTGKQRIIFACFSSYGDVPDEKELKHFNRFQLSELTKRLNVYLVDKYI